jgi:hypothetical protein
MRIDVLIERTSHNSINTYRRSYHSYVVAGAGCMRQHCARKREIAAAATAYQRISMRLIILAMQLKRRAGAATHQARGREMEKRRKGTGI